MKAARSQASKKELLKKFIEGARDDDDYLLACLEYAFDNALAAYRREKSRPTTEQKAKRAAERTKEANAHAKLVARIKSSIVVLNQVMPNGKKLRDCTGEECMHFGGWLKRLATVVGAKNRVGDVVDEQQARAIYRQPEV